MVMDRDFFEMTMHDFGVYMLNLNSNCDIPKDNTVKDRYFNSFKRFENKRFAKLVSWLYVNYPKKTFPTIAEFYGALNSTGEGTKEYVPEKRESVSVTERSKAFKRCVDGMKMLDHLEMEVTRKKMGMKFSTNVSRNTSLSYWIPFIKQVLRAGMVYQGGKWLKKSEAKGEHFDPREFYPPEYYK